MGLINKLFKIFKISNQDSNTERPSIYTKDIFKDKNYNIGAYTYGKPNVIFDNQGTNLKIGKFCSIAANVTIFLGGNHRTDWISTYPFNVLSDDFPAAKKIAGHPATKGDVIIGNDVWIGNNVTILSGITVGDGAVIATGAIVSKNIGAYEVWGGNPAVLIKKRFDDKQIQKLLNIKWWDWEIEKINKNVELLCNQNIQENLTHLQHESAV